jgi:hypothetical protein
MTRRVAVTGMGVVTPHGIGKAVNWQKTLAGESGIRPITLFDTAGYRTARVPLERSLDPLMLGNVVLPPFSILWAAVDLVSGAGFRLSPTFVSVDLQPEAQLAGAGRSRPQPPSASCVAAAE